MSFENHNLYTLDPSHRMTFPSTLASLWQVLETKHEPERGLGPRTHTLPSLLLVKGKRLCAKALMPRKSLLLESAPALKQSLGNRAGVVLHSEALVVL